MPVAEFLVNLLEAYAALGLLFAIVFVTVGIGRIDTVAKGSTVGFRLIVMPGTILLWPFLLSRWIKSSPRTTDLRACAKRGRAE